MQDAAPAPRADHTGERPVALARRRLADLAALPTAEQVAGFDEVHRLLQAALTDVDRDVERHSAATAPEASGADPAPGEPRRT